MSKKSKISTILGSKMAKLIFLLCISINLFVNSNAYSKCETEPTRVAIVDTGLDLKDPRFASLICKDGHNWDFVEKTPMKFDRHGHGTHIAGLIKQYAGDANFCFLVYRYYDNSSAGINNLMNEVNAIKQAVKDRADFVNISGGGADRSEIECNEIKSAYGTTFVLAAGNDGMNLDLPLAGYYPACCGTPNIIIVGSLGKTGKKLPSSNYGTRVTEWELGYMVLSTLPGGQTGTMSGTSQATAIATGKAVAKRINSCKVPRTKER